MIFASSDSREIPWDTHDPQKNEVVDRKAETNSEPLKYILVVQSHCKQS